MATLRADQRDAGNTPISKRCIHLGIKRFFILSATFAAFWRPKEMPPVSSRTQQHVEAVSGNVCTSGQNASSPDNSFAGRRLLNNLKCLRKGNSAPRSGCWSGGKCSHFGPPDRAKQHGIGLLTTFNRRRRQWLPVVINGCAAYIVMAGGDAHRKAVAHGIQHFQRLGHHFRTNTVPRQYGIIR